MVDEAGHVGGDLFGRVANVGAAGPSGSALVGDDYVIAVGESAHLTAPAGAEGGQARQQQHGRSAGISVGLVVQRIPLGIKRSHHNTASARRSTWSMSATQG
jgi:hypothetical protein